MIKIKLTVSKIPKERIFEGKKGKYLDLVLIENKEGPDEYGNDGFVKIDVSKDAREAGENGEICGNWKVIGGGKPKQESRPMRSPTPPAKRDDPSDPESDIPF